MVWDWVRLAHNPEVAGSNPAPATNASAVLPQVIPVGAEPCQDTGGLGFGLSSLIPVDEDG
jgi:hypothetical protein